MKLRPHTRIDAPRGWTEWDRDGREDDIQSFDLCASDEVRIRVHVNPDGRAEVVISPMGILLGQFPTATEAFDAGTRQARLRAVNALNQAARSVADSYAALTYLDALNAS